MSNTEARRLTRPTAQQDVTGVAPVPEPGTLAFGTLATGALLTRRRHQRSR